jgi:hypothetical protein
MFLYKTCSLSLVVPQSDQEPRLNQRIFKAASRTSRIKTITAYVTGWIKEEKRPYSERNKKMFRDIIEYRFPFASAVMEVA